MESTDSLKSCTPLSIALKLVLPPNGEMVIDGINALPLMQQLDILNLTKISTSESRDTVIEKLCDELIDLKHSATKQQQLHSLLRTFYDESIRLNDINPTEWDVQQLPFSFFLYLMKRLRRKPEDDGDRKEYEKDIKSANAMWMFVHYLIMFCAEKEWDGMEMKKYWDQITQNGQKTNGFALKFAKMICNHYGHKLGKYARVRKMVPFWYQDALGIDSRDDEKAPDQPLIASTLNDGMCIGHRTCSLQVD